MLIPQLVPRKALLILLLAALAVFLVAYSSGSSSADSTTTISDNHWFIVQQVGTLNYYSVVGRSSASTTAVWESFEVPGGVGGYHLRLYHHTAYGAYENMVNCTKSNGTYPFCMRFGALKTEYTAGDGDYLVYHTLNQSCLAPANSFYVCKWSMAQWVTSETEAEARATRIMTVPTVNYALLGFSRMNSRPYDVED